MKRQVKIIMAFCSLLLTFFASFLLLKADGKYIVDTVGMISEENAESLDTFAEKISGHYGVGVYLITVEANYGEIDAAADHIYHMTYDLGIGNDRDGILLFVDQRNREYSILVNGSRAGYAFNSYGISQLKKQITEDFRNDQWTAGFQHYLESCEEYLERASSSNPVRGSQGAGFLIILAASCMISFLICLMMRQRNKTVRKGTVAQSYIKVPLHLKQKSDLYLRTETTVRKIRQSEKISSNGSKIQKGKF